MGKLTISVMAVLCVLGANGVWAQGNRGPDEGHKKRHIFVDNRDGTVTDTLTGLMWEKKTGGVGSEIVCITPSDCADPTNVNNRYTWSVSGTAPDGSILQIS